MNNEIKIFENPDFGQVRVVVNESNEPLFCLADVCKTLGLTNASVVKEQIIKEFGDDLSQTYPILDSLGRKQEAVFIGESHLYFVMMRSDKPNAKSFRLWITKDVIPSIRKTGSYSVKPMSQAELLLQQAQVIVDLEKRQLVQEGKIQQLTEENEVIRKDFDYLKSKTNNTPDFYSVIGFCYLKGISINLEDAKQLGKEASKICKSCGISTGSLPDPRFGRIKTYPYRVLETVVESKISISKSIKLN